MLQEVRVQSVILDATHPSYFGEASIGCIIYSPIDESVMFTGRSKTEPFIAFPLNINISQYPVPQEIVRLIGGIKEDYMTTGRSKPYYFTFPTPVFNNPSSNQLPTVIDEENEFYEGEYFIGDRLSKIRPLRPYEGDIMLQGRYGQSIRFGATTDPTVSAPNNWSSTGKVGNPITIIRNGQKEELDKEGYELIEEDINNDNSSIYLCSDQQITTFKPASTYDESYGRNIFTDNIGEEITPTNEELGPDVEEDISLNTADNLPAQELIKNEELAQLPSVEQPGAYYDVSETENQEAITVNNNNELPNNYEIPASIQNTTALNTPLG